MLGWLMVHSLDSPNGHGRPQFRPWYPPTACQHLTPLTPRLVLACSTASPQVCFLWALNRPFNQIKSLADRSFNQGGRPVHKQHQNKRPRPKRHSRVLTVRLRCSHHAHCSDCTTHFSFFQFDFIPISLESCQTPATESFNSTCAYTWTSVLSLPPRRTFPLMCYRFSSSHLHLRMHPRFPTFLFAIAAASLPQPN